MSLAEIEQELHGAGLCQPALSLLNGAVHRDACKVRKRDHRAADEQTPWSSKRCRSCPQSLPLQVCDNNVRVHPTMAPAFPISAYPGAKAVGIIVPYSCPPLSLKSGNITFVFSEWGYLLAELPKPNRPVMMLACGRHVEVAKAALDSKGIAYLWSEDGDLLASIAPIHQHDDQLSNGTQIQLLNVKQSAKNDTIMFDFNDEAGVQLSDAHSTDSSNFLNKQHMIEELDEFSPSTTVPDSPDCADMDMD